MVNVVLLPFVNTRTQIIPTEKKWIKISYRIKKNKNWLRFLIGLRIIQCLDRDGTKNSMCVKIPSIIDGKMITVIHVGIRM